VTAQAARESAAGELRVGVLGAARIVRTALLAPARAVPDLRVTVVGARDPARAAAYVRRHGIAHAADGYQAVLEHPEVDAVYIPLPNSLHAEWVIRAAQSGKHVLCEKPFVSNAVQAQTVADAVAGGQAMVMQAFHYRYHPFFERLRQVVASGELGAIRRMGVTLHAPIPPGRDIRWNFDLAGGSMMDLGSYAVHMLRHLGGEEPTVKSATAKTIRDVRLDRWMRAELEFPSGYGADLDVAMWSGRALELSLTVVGELGTMKVRNPLMPQLFGRAVIRTRDGRRVDHAERRPSYLYQLEAFRNAALDGAPILTGAEDGVATMRVIDAIYTAAGLPIRPGF
jgi:predicted dehydrogenase